MKQGSRLGPNGVPVRAGNSELEKLRRQMTSGKKQIGAGVLKDQKTAIKRPPERHGNRLNTTEHTPVESDSDSDGRAATFKSKRPKKVVAEPLPSGVLLGLPNEKIFTTDSASQGNVSGTQNDDDASDAQLDPSGGQELAATLVPDVRHQAASEKTSSSPSRKKLSALDVALEERKQKRKKKKKKKNKVATAMEIPEQF